MTTARDFIILCLKEAGVTGVGQTPLDEDINDSFILLKRMLAQWQRRRWIVPNLIDVYAPGNSAKSNLIGPGQYYNSARPDKIQAAYFKQLNSGDVANDVSYPLRMIWSYEDYANIALKELNTWPSFFFYDGAFPYGNVFIWPIPTSQYEIHLIVKGNIGFNIQLLAVEKTVNGTLYTDGVYQDIPFVNVSSFGAAGTADVTVAGGVVTIDAIHTPGDGYKIRDILTLDTTNMGATGAGFLCKVTNVTQSLDAEFNMPEEYEEAIHYNLCVRLVAHYQLPINRVQGVLAKTSLATIKQSNLQIPSLQMPGSLRFSNAGGSFYIFNADQH